jgi:hypothetical protein
MYDALIVPEYVQNLFFHAKQMFAAIHYCTVAEQDKCRKKMSGGLDDSDSDDDSSARTPAAITLVARDRTRVPIGRAALAGARMLAAALSGDDEFNASDISTGGRDIPVYHVDGAILARVVQWLEHRAVYAAEYAHERNADDDENARAATTTDWSALTAAASSSPGSPHGDGGEGGDNYFRGMSINGQGRRLGGGNAVAPMPLRGSSSSSSPSSLSLSLHAAESTLGAAATRAIATDEAAAAANFAAAAAAANVDATSSNVSAAASSSSSSSSSSLAHVSSFGGVFSYQHGGAPFPDPLRLQRGRHSDGGGGGGGGAGAGVGDNTTNVTSIGASGNAVGFNDGVGGVPSLMSSSSSSSSSWSSQTRSLRGCVSTFDSDFVSVRTCNTMRSTYLQHHTKQFIFLVRLECVHKSHVDCTI